VRTRKPLVIQQFPLNSKTQQAETSVFIAQKGTIDVTAWLACFLVFLHRSVDEAQNSLDTVLAKSRFWRHFAGTPKQQMGSDCQVFLGHRAARYQ